MGRAPDLLQDLRLGHHPPGVAQQQRQQRVLLAGQRHRLAIQRHFTAHQVHVQVAVVEHRRGAVTGYAAGAQQRPYPRHQFLRAERLGDIVIGAGIQRPHLLGLAGAHGQHDHRHLAPLPQLFKHLVAFHVRQADIQDHQVHVLAGGQLQAFLAGGRLPHLVALRAQADVQEPADLGFIVDHQHARGRHAGINRGRAHRGRLA
ncbi:hypothetical protein G6F22_016394 [Rhizopus arrhizus]|nr:hypothetical protein G6F22_016394 [Rhizopus arrhizus]